LVVALKLFVLIISQNLLGDDKRAQAFFGKTQEGFSDLHLLFLLFGSLEYDSWQNYTIGALAHQNYLRSKSDDQTHSFSCTVERKLCQNFVFFAHPTVIQIL